VSFISVREDEELAKAFASRFPAKAEHDSAFSYYSLIHKPV
jgi:hypothetical protein